MSRESFLPNGEPNWKVIIQDFPAYAHQLLEKQVISLVGGNNFEIDEACGLGNPIIPGVGRVFFTTARYAKEYAAAYSTNNPKIFHLTEA